MNIYRVQTGKPPIQGLIDCAAAWPGPEDPVVAAERCINIWSVYPPENRALYVQKPALNWWQKDPHQTLKDKGTLVPDAEVWWDAFFGYLLGKDISIRIVILDEEADFQGLNIWNIIGKLDYAKEIMGDPNFKIAPTTVRQFTPERYASLWLDTPDDHVPYSYWVNWSRSLRTAVYKKCLVDKLRKYFPDKKKTIVGHYGDVSNPINDLNGWPQPVGTVEGVAMPDTYPNWIGIATNRNPLSPDWGGIVSAINTLRSSQTKQSVPYISYATWDNDQPENTIRRPIAIWKNRMLWRSAFRMYNELIYWENPTVDTEADNIVAEEIERADKEITKRNKTFPFVKSTDECIITLDHAISYKGLTSI